MITKINSFENKVDLSFILSRIKNKYKIKIFMIYILPTDTCFWIGCPIWSTKDYAKIYSLKQRNLEKPLAIMVENFEYLKKHTFINDLQLNYLKKYPFPFTVLLHTKRDFILEGIPNKNLYKKTAFRVANTPLLISLLTKIGPIFLTSANISNTQEIYSLQDIPFEIDDNMQIIQSEDLEKTPPSDIFEFSGESAKILYLRKNY